MAKNNDTSDLNKWLEIMLSLILVEVLELQIRLMEIMQ